MEASQTEGLEETTQTLDELEDIIHEEWNTISDNVVINICESFPRRVEQCIDMHGNRIRY